MKTVTDKDLFLSIDVIKSSASGTPLLTSAPPPALSIEEADPELAGWLVAEPTVYTNLGTHFQTDEDGVIEMARILRFLFDTAEQKSELPGLRVLWKLKQPLNAPYSIYAKSRVYQVAGVPSRRKGDAG